MAHSVIRFFCPACWAETAGDDRVCPRCGADVEAVQGQRDFVEKLIAALNHPEPETRARAALILGLRKEKRAVEPLLRVVREGKDASLMEAALEALGRLGEPRCRAALETAAIRGTLRVRLAARQALYCFEKGNERH
jgi:HEAT repeat protein